jgi:L-lactate dehydrogenase (cytochrome)
VPRPFFEYIENASYDGLTKRANRRDLDELKFRQRVMRSVAGRSFEVTMLGERVAMPVGLAPAGLAGGIHVNGEIAGARAAQSFGVPFCLSTMSIDSIEDVAGATGRPFWFQLYLMKDRAFTRSLLDRAAAAGCRVLVLTMDLHVEAQRNRDLKNGFGIPPKLTFGNVASVLARPRWALSMLGSKQFTFGNLKGQVKGGLGELIDWQQSQFDQGFDANSIDWVRSNWPGKIVIKGVLDPGDARLAARHGADAVLVSNHGGRQLDGTCSSVSILPKIRDALPNEVELFVDSGIRSGMDVLKMLALGARACFIGRAWLYGLGAGGEAGVTKALQLIRDELDTTMALTGVTDLSNVPPDVLMHEQ